MVFEKFTTEYTALKRMIWNDTPLKHYFTDIDACIWNPKWESKEMAERVLKILTDMSHLLYKNTLEGQAFEKTKTAVELILWFDEKLAA